MTGDIRAAIFDMDGLLVDSEPLWREAEKAVFGEVGVELDDEMCGQTVGLRASRIPSTAPSPPGPRE
jgi:beta-phosphoglucomutase-like phosphatase (HAD superfamily)